MYGWIDPFYDAAGATVEPGQIWHARPLRLPARQALAIERVNPKDDAKLDFTLAERAAEAPEHPPVHSLGLGAAEEAVLARARVEPVVVLGGTTATELGPEGERDAGTVLALPLAAAASHDEPTRRRIAAYAFTNAFYLPAAERFPESYARLDQVQSVPRAQLVDHAGLRLSSDALDALVEWFVAFSTNRRFEGSLIFEYRREQLAGED